MILAPLRWLQLFFERFGLRMDETYPERWQFLMVQDFARARPAFEAYLKQESGLASDWVGLGLCHYFLKDYPAAKMAFDRALEKDPEQDEARLHRSMTFFELREYPKALLDLETLLSKSPETLDYLYAVSWTALFVNPRRSLRLLESTPRLNQEAGLLLNAGHAATLLNQDAEAEGFYRQALELGEQTPQLLRNDWQILSLHGILRPQKRFASLLDPR